VQKIRYLHHGLLSLLPRWAIDSLTRKANNRLAFRPRNLP